MSYPQQPGQFGAPQQPYQNQNQGYVQPGFTPQGYGPPGGYQQPGHGAASGGGIDKVLSIVGMVLAAIHVFFTVIGIFQMLGTRSEYGISVDLGAGFWFSFLLMLAIDGILITLGIRALMKKG